MPMTNAISEPSSYFIKDGNFILEFDSNVDCPVGYDKTKFTATLMCSKAIVGQGNAKIVKVDYQTDPCNL
jgi:hypothetical protein